MSRLACCATLAGLPALVTARALAQAPAAPAPDTAASSAPASTPAEPAAAPEPGAGAPVAEPSPPGPLSLTWTSADPSCDGSQVRARALELVSRSIVPRPTEARAVVEREGERWRVQLETRSQSRMGQRTLRAESCKEIQQAIALLLAMIMEAEAKGETAPPAPPPESLNMLEPEDEPIIIDSPPVEPGRAWSWLVRSESAAAVGLQPSVGFGVSGSVGVSFGAWELHAGGGYWLSSRAPIFERQGAIEMSRATAGASLCYRWLSSGRIELLSCLGPEWLWLDWSTSGLLRNRVGGIHHLLTLNGSLELRVAAVGPLFVTLAPGFTWEQRRPFQAKRCEDCTPTDVFHTWDIGVRFGAGVGARF